MWVYLSTAQETGDSLDWLLSDEGKLRVNLFPMLAFSYKISLIFSCECSSRCWKQQWWQDRNKTPLWLVTALWLFLPPPQSPILWFFHELSQTKLPIWTAAVVPWKAGELSWWHRQVCSSIPTKRAAWEDTPRAPQAPSCQRGLPEPSSALPALSTCVHLLFY